MKDRVLLCKDSESLLAHLREGRCTDSDYDLLSERVASKVFLTENVDNWRRTPMIVCENATKDALNVAATKAFA